VTHKEHHPVAVKISLETVEAIDKLIARYPTSEAALIPALHKVQDDVGWMPVEAMDWVATKLALPKVRVYGVASYYTMFLREKPGKHQLEICTNLSCSLMGAEHLRSYLEKKLGIRAGETSSDGRFTLTEVECLGACGFAPVMIVDGEYHENLDPKKVDEILATLDRQDKESGKNG